jgi:hypothetical protein
MYLNIFNSKWSYMIILFVGILVAILAIFFYSYFINKIPFGTTKTFPNSESEAKSSVKLVFNETQSPAKQTLVVVEKESTPKQALAATATQSPANTVIQSPANTVTQSPANTVTQSPANTVTQSPDTKSPATQSTTKQPVDVTIPGVPTITSVEAINGTANVHYNPGANNGLQITGYTYSIWTDDVPTWTNIVTSNPFLITGLKHTYYQIRIKANSVKGDSDYSSPFVIDCCKEYQSSTGSKPTLFCKADNTSSVSCRISKTVGSTDTPIVEYRYKINKYQDGESNYITSSSDFKISDLSPDNIYLVSASARYKNEVFSGFSEDAEIIITTSNIMYAVLITAYNYYNEKTHLTNAKYYLQNYILNNDTYDDKIKLMRLKYLAESMINKYDTAKYPITNLVEQITLMLKGKYNTELKGAGPIWGIPGIEYRSHDSKSCTGLDVFGSNAPFCMPYDDNNPNAEDSQNIWWQMRWGIPKRPEGCEYDKQYGNNKLCPPCNVPKNASGIPHSATFPVFHDASGPTTGYPIIITCGTQLCPEQRDCTQDDYDRDMYGRFLTLSKKSEPLANEIESDTIAALINISTLKQYLTKIF